MVIKKLVESGNITKLINMADSKGDSALHFASRGGFTAIVKLLLELGADIKLNSAGLKPKDVAANNNISSLFQ